MAKIKVIKRAELKKKKEKPAKIVPPETPEETNEKMASTVSQWVNDLEIQREKQTRQTREKFFVTPAGNDAEK